MNHDDSTDIEMSAPAPSQEYFEGILAGFSLAESHARLFIRRYFADAAARQYTQIGQVYLPPVDEFADGLEVAVPRAILAAARQFEAKNLPLCSAKRSAATQHYVPAGIEQQARERRLADERLCLSAASVSLAQIMNPLKQDRSGVCVGVVVSEAADQGQNVLPVHPQSIIGHDDAGVQDHG